MKKCKKCTQTKDITQYYVAYFIQDKPIYSASCKSCQNKRSSQWNSNNKLKRKNILLKNLYGISLENYFELLKKQDNKCAICSSTQNNKNKTYFDVDHCHKTGKVRGLLCQSCNSGLGKFEDKIELFKRAINYLEKMAKIVAISDIHCRWNKIGQLPECDILISAGDYSFRGEKHVVEDFHKWLNKQDAGHIISVQGNHEVWVEKNFEEAKAIAEKACPGVHFIGDHGTVEIEGIKIHGSAITPWFHSWAWNVQRGPDIAKEWAKIPDDTNIIFLDIFIALMDTDILMELAIGTLQFATRCICLLTR